MFITSYNQNNSTLSILQRCKTMRTGCSCLYWVPEGSVQGMALRLALHQPQCWSVSVGCTPSHQDLRGSPPPHSQVRSQEAGNEGLRAGACSLGCWSCRHCRNPSCQASLSPGQSCTPPLQRKPQKGAPPSCQRACSSTAEGIEIEMPFHWRLKYLSLAAMAFITFGENRITPC